MQLTPTKTQMKKNIEFRFPIAKESHLMESNKQNRLLDYDILII